MFNLAYGLNWTYEDMLEMPLEELLRFHQMLQEQWDKERADVENA